MIRSRQQIPLLRDLRITQLSESSDAISLLPFPYGLDPLAKSSYIGVTPKSSDLKIPYSVIPPSALDRFQGRTPIYQILLEGLAPVAHVIKAKGLDRPEGLLTPPSLPSGNHTSLRSWLIVPLRRQEKAFSSVVTFFLGSRVPSKEEITIWEVVSPFHPLETLRIACRPEPVLAGQWDHDHPLPLHLEMLDHVFSGRLVRHDHTMSACRLMRERAAANTSRCLRGKAQGMTTGMRS